MVSAPDHVVGVDFSGAKNARDNVWIAEIDGDGRLEACAPVSERLADLLAGADPAATMGALRAFVRHQPGGTAVGFDFPFGLPAPVVSAFGAKTWRGSLDAVAGVGNVEAFETSCRDVVGDGRTYLRRETDESDGALSPYHRFVRHQTYHGMVDLLRPLVAGEAVWVIPMDLAAADDSLPWVLEVYPSAVLDRLGLPAEGYKGRERSHRRRRATALEGLRSVLSIGDDLAERIVEDTGGDALDAVAAAVGTRQAFDWGLEPPGTVWRREGHSYP